MALHIVIDGNAGIRGWWQTSKGDAMNKSERCPNVVVNFWEWYRRRQERERSLLARYALDKCEEAYKRSEWDRFGYWFGIYRRERVRGQNGSRSTRYK